MKLLLNKIHKRMTTDTKTPEQIAAAKIAEEKQLAEEIAAEEAEKEANKNLTDAEKLDAKKIADEKVAAEEASKNFNNPEKNIQDPKAKPLDNGHKTGLTKTNPAGGAIDITKEGTIKREKKAENAKTIAMKLFNKARKVCSELIGDEENMEKFLKQKEYKFMYAGVGGSLVLGANRLTKENCNKNTPFITEDKDVAVTLIGTTLVLPL